MAAEARPGERYWAVVEPFWDSIDIHASPAEFLAQFSAVPRAAGHLFAAHWCQSEVRNGGFYQFFYNSTGILAPEACAGFSAIGIAEWAQVLAEAMNYFGPHYPREREKRMAMLPRSSGKRREWDPFYALDERFYSWMGTEPDRWDHVADQFAETAK